MKKLINLALTGVVFVSLGMFGCKKSEPAQSPTPQPTAYPTATYTPTATTTAPGPMMPGMPLPSLPCSQPTGQCMWNYCDVAAQRCKQCAGPQDCISGAMCTPLGVCVAMPGAPTQ
jgi:hypothetical protein